MLRTPAVLVQPGELPKEDLSLPKLVVVLVVESPDDEPGPILVIGVVTDGEMMADYELDC